MSASRPPEPPRIDPETCRAAWSAVPEPIRRLRQREPGIAAFDADGTLWEGDVSEDFARWMIERGDFDGGRWEEYRALEAADPAAGALDILRFYAGHSRPLLEERVEAFWAEGPPRRWIPETVAAVFELAEAGFAVYVVSASPAPVLAPLARRLPLREILALEMELVDDRYTGRATGTPTLGPGKLHRLRERCGSDPDLAAGNSPPDRELLRAARHPWLIGDDPRILEEARRDGWNLTPPPGAR